MLTILLLSCLPLPTTGGTALDPNQVSCEAFCENAGPTLVSHKLLPGELVCSCALRAHTLIATEEAPQ